MKNFLFKNVGKAWMAAVYIFLYLPLLFMIVFSFNSTRQDAQFTGFSFRWYDALTRDNRIVDGFWPLVMPEVVIGLSLLLLMVGAQNIFGWPQRGMLTIIVGHTLLGMAYGMVVIQSRLLEMDRSIEEAAMDLGARPLQVFLLAFTLSFDDVVISEFLSGPGVNTLPQVIFGYARRGINPTIYAAATLLIATVTVVIVSYSVWVARQTRRREREIAAATRAELTVLKS